MPPINPRYGAIGLAALLLGLSLVMFLHIDVACAGPIPAGGYMQSCRDIVADGSMLSATCKNFNGDWAGRTTLNFSGCVGDIFNYDGKLQCLGASPPAGSYRSSCNELEVGSGNILLARCKNFNGTWVTTSLNLVCSGDISNIDGHLNCNQSSTPPGSYTSSCWNIMVSGPNLTATCRTKSGGIRQTVMSVFGNCSGFNDIVNQDGTLQCVSRNPQSSCQWGNPSGTPNCGAQIGRQNLPLFPFSEEIQLQHHR